MESKNMGYSMPLTAPIYNEPPYFIEEEIMGETEIPAHFSSSLVIAIY